MIQLPNCVSPPVSKSQRTVFVCQECGAQSPKWRGGQCPDCNAWNSFVQDRAGETGRAPATGHRYAMAGAVGGGARLYASIDIEQHARRSTGMGEFDRVLGGG